MRLLKAGLAVLPMFLVTASALAEEAHNVILDQYGSWRMFHVLKSPEIAFDDGVKPIVYTSEHYWLNGESPAPPVGWNKPEFDDGDWLRGPVGMECRAPFCARTCLRGRFHVSDPAQVTSLKCEATYQGGVVVYLNGEEAGRQNLAVGATLADTYPLDAFVMPDGKLFGNPDKPNEEMLKRMKLRRRAVELELPVRLLRKGGNVLAIEIVRSPCHKVVDEQKVRIWNGMLFDVAWNTCELLEVCLTASGKGVEANVTRPPGLQLWNSSLLRSDFVLDFGDPCETLRPVVITGVRNGAFSEKVVLGSTKPIRGLKATIRGLQGSGGSIPASALQVRYAVQWGAEYGIFDHTFGFGVNTARNPPEAGTLSMLLDAPPEEYPIIRAKAPHVGGKEREVFGAVAPLWVTVRIPASARPGDYVGTLSVSCEDEKPVEVPLRLEVADWTLL